MKRIIFLLSFITISIIIMSAFNPIQQTSGSEAVENFHGFTINGLMGDQIDMSDFEGKYILCVNVASKCGYTKQYKPLQSLYEQHKDKLVIIGFPCNQFLGQEPGEAEEIASFCQKNYGVSFPMTEKINVKGKKQHPIYAWLTNKEQNGVADAKVGWNFNKFLISPEGDWVGHFKSGVDPLGEEIVAKLK